ncbi:MAG TPA: hypothetical protein VGK71_05080 [Nitrospirota bacterium]|jgi:hypothetical protein
MESAIYKIIERNQGKGRAITAEHILAEVGSWPRGVRGIRDEIKRLIEDEAALIAASGVGYFIPTTFEEINEYERILDKRARSIFIRRGALQRAKCQLPPVQTRLELAIN